MVVLKGLRYGRSWFVIMRFFPVKSKPSFNFSVKILEFLIAINVSLDFSVLIDTLNHLIIDIGQEANDNSVKHVLIEDKHTSH